MYLVLLSYLVESRDSVMMLLLSVFVYWLLLFVLVDQWSMLGLMNI